MPSLSVLTRVLLPCRPVWRIIFAPALRIVATSPCCVYQINVWFMPPLCIVTSPSPLWTRLAYILCFRSVYCRESSPLRGSVLRKAYVPAHCIVLSPPPLCGPASALHCREFSHRVKSISMSKWSSEEVSHFVKRGGNKVGCFPANHFLTLPCRSLKILIWQNTTQATSRSQTLHKEHGSANS